MTPTDMQIQSRVAHACYGPSLKLITITLYTAQYTSYRDRIRKGSKVS